MSDAAPPLRLVEDGDEPDAEASDPKVFARSVSVPPGAPWDQARAARLEARAGAPLPIGEVSYQLRRLGAWRPGQPAKYAAFYVRAKDVGQRLRSECLVDGRWMEVVFVSRAERERHARFVTGLFAAAAIGLVLGLTSVAVAISARRSAEAQLADLEKVAAGKSILAKTVEFQRRQTRALDDAGLKGRSLSDYLSDLDWVSAAKAPGARIQALHWDRGAMAIEERGDTPPIAGGERTVTKVDKPLRPGLWLWGVTTRSSEPASPPKVETAGGQGGGAP